MRVSIDRLRVWLLLGAGVLVAVLAGFLEYAHLASHRFLKNLPGKLGAEISREANGFTYSQSNGKRTLYTIHAAKFVQRKNSVVTLRDVGVVLYDTAGRADRMFGKEFEYDQTAGVMRASGEVFLDLAAPAPGDAKERAAYAAGALATKSEEESAADPRAIHVRTSGVEFRQKEGVVATDQEADFRYGETHGSAVGAEFRSDTGVTVLQSRVELLTIRGGRPVRLTASRAELDRGSQEARLERAEITGLDAKGAVDGTQGAARADRATVLLRTSARPEEVRAAGSVMLSGRGATVRADGGEVLLGERDEPRSAELVGSVRYAADKADRHVEGRADVAHAAFTEGGVLERVRLAGGASAREREALADRTLTARVVDLQFASMAAGARAEARRVWLRQGTATGGARLVAHQAEAGSAGRVRTDEVAGDMLVAHLRQVERREQVVAVEGEGHTEARRGGGDGAELDSSGDQLRATFAAAAKVQTLETAEQVGHVQFQQRSAVGEGKAARVSGGKADHATYVAATDLVVLHGGVQMMQEGGLLWADDVTLKQGTGDTNANGRVRASYKAEGGSEPVEVQAARAEMRHDAGMAIFFGRPDREGGQPARMWQGGSSVEAAVIELDQKEQTLRAHGVVDGAEVGAVRTVLGGDAQNGPTTTMGTRKGRPTPQVTRVNSGTLVYTGSTRQALFSSGAQVVEGDLRLRGDRSTVFLLPAKGDSSAAGARTSPFPGSGSLDRIVTTGSVHVDEAGRQATGDRLVYTAADRVSVLTGSAGKPPVVTDAENGTLSGTEIRFMPGDHGESTVVVSGGGTSQPKVRKDARVR